MKPINLIAALLAAVMSVPVMSYAAEPEFAEATQSQNYIDYMELSEEERKGLIEPFPAELIPLETGVELFDTPPESFDAREQGWTSPVISQMQTNSCWAFSASENLEMLIRKNTGLEFEFSKRHMENATAQNPNDLTNPGAFGMSDEGFEPREVDSGGNSYMAAAYYLRGSGPVDESSMPFENNIVPESTASLYQETTAWVRDYAFLGDLSSKSTDADKEALKLKIKNAVMDYGSAAVGIRMRSSSGGYTGYNASNYSFYSPNNTYSTNHAVLIVGWDDNYPKENFTYTPSDDGAWIIQNSWGSGWGDEGYFYVSYDEKSIYAFTASVADAETDIGYDNCYSLDPLGWSSSIGYPSSTYAANIFEKPAGTEMLTEVAVGNNGAEEYEVLVNPSGDSLNLRDLEAVASGSFTMNGYQTITLDTPVELTGTKFAVVVRYTKSGDEYAYIPREKQRYDTIWSKADAEPGTSYISSSGISWTEISNEKYGYSNCSIKAFTQDVTPKAKITFEKSNPKSLVYISDASGFEFTPKANGTYSVPEGEYLYTASEYEQDDITGTFLAEGTDKTLYIYDDPAEISEAGEGFAGLLEECGQSWSIKTIEESLVKRFGSTFRLEAADGFTFVPPTAELNGRISGILKLKDTFRGEETELEYDRTLYKAALSDTGSSVEITGRSDTDAEVFVAKYDESGSFLGLELTEISVTEGETVTIPYNKNDAAYVSIFLWDTDRLYPYAAGLK